MLLRFILSFCFVLCAAPLSWASLFSNESDGPLPAHEAIRFTAEQDNAVLTIAFELADNVYLYQDKLKFSLLDKTPYSSAQFIETPEVISDPSFGDVAVFFNSATATLDLSNLPENTSQLKMRYQGCDQAIGLCSPNQRD